MSFLQGGTLVRGEPIAIGPCQSGPEREDGSRSVDLSIGKGRMSGGDRVVPMTYWGRSGRWCIAGAARSAAEVRAERQDQSAGKRVELHVHAISSVLDNSPEPMSRRRIHAVTGGRESDVRAVVKILLAAQRGEPGDVVEVGQIERAAYKVWTRRRADASGVPIRPSALQQEGQP
jgi:hypothetical protein